MLKISCVGSFSLLRLYARWCWAGKELRTITVVAKCIGFYAYLFKMMSLV